MVAGKTTELEFRVYNITLDACNYRPISLLSVFDKLFEKVMYNHLYQHLEYNNILYKYQFGFRKNHGTNLALG